MTKLITFNTEIVDELALTESFKAIRACIQCGNCSAVCASGEFTALRTRNVIRKALLGLESVLSDPDIWHCSTCFNCLEVCPRNIPVTEIILNLRNIAVRKGYMPEALKGVIKNLVQHGHAVPLGADDSTWARLRTYHGLETIPPTVRGNPNELDEIYTLLNKIRFNGRIPYR